MSDTWRIVIALLALGVITEGMLIVALMRQVGGLLLHGTPIRGDAAAGPQVGTVVNLPGHELKGRPALVVFVSSGCDECTALIPKLQGIHAAYGPDAADGHQFDLIAVLTDRHLTERERLAAELGSFARTDLVALMQDWHVPGTPFVVAVDAQHRVRGAAVANSQMQLEMLAVQTFGALFVPPDGRFEDRARIEITQLDSNSSHSVEVLP
jgi:hypothetical protein